MKKQLSFYTFNIALILAITFQAVFPQCEINVGKGEPAKKWTDDFSMTEPGKGLAVPNNPALTGADSTFSILLPNGDSAFFFSDSFIAEYPAKPGDGRIYLNENGLRMRKPNCIPPICGPAEEHIHYVYNSVVIRSKDGTKLRTITGEKDKNGYSTAFFKPNSTDDRDMYWLGDPIMVEVDGKKKIWMFLNEWNVARPFDKSFWIKYRNQAIAQIDPETMQLESITNLRNKNDEAVWGISMWMDESNGKKDLYIYGMRNEEEIQNANKSNVAVANKYKRLYIAKVDAKKGLSGVTDLKNWTAWDGKKWNKNLNRRITIIPQTDSISDELTIRRLNINGKPTFVMVTFDTSKGYSEWKDLYLYSACDPQGPFDKKHHFYTTPTAGQKKFEGMTAEESLKNGLSVYNPHMHPQFTQNGKLLVSYNSNLPFGSPPGDSIFADFYRPRFVWVPIEGLQAEN